MLIVIASSLCSSDFTLINKVSVVCRRINPLNSNEKSNICFWKPHIGNLTPNINGYFFAARCTKLLLIIKCQWTRGLISTEYIAACNRVMLSMLRNPQIDRRNSITFFYKSKRLDDYSAHRQNRAVFPEWNGMNRSMPFFTRHSILH